MRATTAREPGDAGGPERNQEVIDRLEAQGVGTAYGATEFLQSVRAAAAYQPTPGEPGILYVGDQTEYGDLRHEERHFEQDRDAGFSAPYSEVRKSAMELDAYQYELEHTAAWGYSSGEIERVQDEFYNELDRHAALSE